jgi:hypothetical protein
MAATHPAAAAASNPTPNQYSWSSELVAIDAAASTVTLKARVVTGGRVESLKPGDRATLVWSGSNWAAGVLAVKRAAPGAEDRLTLPIEFVAHAPDSQYVSFKVTVPRAELADIEKLGPGDWVTGISSRNPDAPEAVADLRPYVDAG